MDKRKKITADIDRDIARVETKLARLIPTLSDENGDDGEGPRPGSYKDQIIKFLSEHPDSDYATIAKGIYGTSDESSRNKVRSHCFILGREERIESSEPGRWRVSQKSQ